MPDAQTMVVVCPTCHAIFELPAELYGQLGECTECGAVFNIEPYNGDLSQLQQQGAQPQQEAAEQYQTQYQMPDQPQQMPQEEAAEQYQTQDQMPDQSQTVLPEEPSPDEIDHSGDVPLKRDEGATNTVKLSRAKVGMVPQINDGYSVGVVQTHQTATRKKFVSGTRTAARTAAKTGTKPPAPKPQKKSFWEKLMFWK